jgi:hypothetical protein
MEVDKRNGKPKQRVKDIMHLTTLLIRRRDKGLNDIKHVLEIHFGEKFFFSTN